MKKLFLIPFLAFVLVACGDDAEKKLQEALENAYVDGSGGNTILEIDPAFDIAREDISDKADYNNKSGYGFEYRIEGQSEGCKFNVVLYKMDNKIISFYYLNSCSVPDKNGKEHGFKRVCNVELVENIMKSEECGDKSSEITSKILNAIQHKKYFDY